MGSQRRVGEVKEGFLISSFFILSLVIAMIVGGCSTDQALQEKGQKPTEAEVQFASYYRSWKNSEHLDHKHALNEIDCADSHGDRAPKQGLTKAQCLECHESYESIAKTAPIHTMLIQPHFRDHEVECSDCHKVHKASVLVCSECHHFDIKVP
jgi:fumarate reductase flavoprotein subunit